MTPHSPQSLVMSKTDLQRAYDRFAPSYNRADWIIEHLLGVKKLRRLLLARAQGDVLDVACGTGTNLRYLPNAQSITAVDLSPGMLAEAQKRAQQLNLSATFHEMDAESLAFPDENFDTVISTMSTCTFPDTVAALREMARVCRADGRILLLEHGLSTKNWLARFQHRTAPRHFRAVGCRWNQDTLALVEKAGLRIQSARRALLGILHAIEALPG